MKWAKGTTQNGLVITGAITDDVFHPRVSLGAEASGGRHCPCQRSRCRHPSVKPRKLAFNTTLIHLK